MTPFYGAESSSMYHVKMFIFVWIFISDFTVLFNYFLIAYSFSMKFYSTEISIKPPIIINLFKEVFLLKEAFQYFNPFISRLEEI